MANVLRGIVVENNSQARTGGLGQQQIKVSAVEIRYRDGSSFTFIPGTRSEFFGQMVAGRILDASRQMEWDETDNRLSM